MVKETEIGMYMGMVKYIYLYGYEVWIFIGH